MHSRGKPHMGDRRDAVRIFLAVVAAIAALSGTTAFAQGQRLPLSQVLPDLVLREIVLESPPQSQLPGSPAGFTHTAHFSPLGANELDNPVVGIVRGFNGQMATQFSTFPLGS